MAKVPYTRTETLTDADREYLALRSPMSPKAAQLLEMNKLVNDVRQIAQKLDTDPGVSDTDYEATTIDD